MYLALKQQLNQHQLSMVQSEMEHKMKSMAVAYLLAIFLGYFGAHRFYVRKTARPSLNWCSSSSGL